MARLLIVHRHARPDLELRIGHHLERVALAARVASTRPVAPSTAGDSAAGQTPDQGGHDTDHRRPSKIRHLVHVPAGTGLAEPFTMTMSKLEAISEDLLSSTSGGRQTFHELEAFAQQHHFTVTSSTGGRHLGWAHRAGRAVDVRTRGQSAASIRSFIHDARSHGITVLDERGGGNAAWSGPHLHLQK